MHELRSLFEFMPPLPFIFSIILFSWIIGVSLAARKAERLGRAYCERYGLEYGKPKPIFQMKD